MWSVIRGHLDEVIERDLDEVGVGEVLLAELLPARPLLLLVAVLMSMPPPAGSMPTPGVILA